jgi:hypothetical protein
MSLGQGVTIGAQVCDERALFEYETLQSSHELPAAHWQSIAQRFARTARVLLCLAVSLRVLGERNSSVAI